MHLLFIALYAIMNQVSYDTKGILWGCNEHRPTNLEAKNTAAIFTAQVVVLILCLALSISIARNLGAVVFGKYSFALAFTAVFAVYSDLGYSTLRIIEVARDKSQASKNLNNIMFMSALLRL